MNLLIESSLFIFAKKKNVFGDLTPKMDLSVLGNSVSHTLFADK